MKASKAITIAVLVMIMVTAIVGCGVTLYGSDRNGTYIKAEKVAIIEDGKTTRDQVLMQFGSPNNVLDNGRVWMYEGGSRTTIIGIPSSSKTRLTVIFNGDLVKSHALIKE
jgi:outer membrane protein assembly factor BamE (lipoprotein component of BamABCDE complex)